MTTKESPYSWNTTAVDENGYNEQFTLRANDEKSFFEKIASLKVTLNLSKYKPFVKQSSFVRPPPKEKDWTGEKCPNDSGRLYRVTTGGGKKCIKCENSKWDPFKKQNTGCVYIQWVNDEQTQTNPVNTGSGKIATPAQVNLIVKLQGEGKISETVVAKTLPFEEAKTLISSSINK